MAFVPHFYPDYRFPPDEFSEITSVIGHQDHSLVRSSGSFSSTNMSSGAISSSPPSGGGAMLGHDHYDHNFPTFYGHKNGGRVFDIFQGESEIISPSMPSSVPNNPLPERFGISADMVVPTLMDYNSKVLGAHGDHGIAKIQNFDGRYQLPADVCEYREDCCGFLPNFTPICPAASSAENWGLEYNPMAETENSNTIKVGRYTVEERKDRILRYLKKRNQRNFNKTIKYACRKTLADRRVRVRGRFARNNEIFEEESDDKKNYISPPYLHQAKESYCTSDAIQMKNDDEDDEQWLQEALASLMYVPYIAG